MEELKLCSCMFALENCGSVEKPQIHERERDRERERERERFIKMI